MHDADKEIFHQSGRGIHPWDCRPGFARVRGATRGGAAFERKNFHVVDVIGRARGFKKAHKMLADFIRRVGDIDHAMPSCFGYTGFSEEALVKYVNEYAMSFKEALSILPIVPVGATVGTYAGPDAVALAFFDDSCKAEVSK